MRLFALPALPPPHPPEESSLGGLFMLGLRLREFPRQARLRNGQSGTLGGVAGQYLQRHLRHP